MLKMILVGVVAFGFGVFANNFVSKYEISAIKPAQAAVGGKNWRQLAQDKNFELAVRSSVGRLCSVTMRNPGNKAPVYC